MPLPIPHLSNSGSCRLIARATQNEKDPASDRLRIANNKFGISLAGADAFNYNFADYVSSLEVNMHRFALVTALAALCFVSILGSAQSPAVQLCVAKMQVSGTNNANPVGQDQLMKSLNKQKPDKALSIANVPILPAVPEEALTAAKEKSCDYLVTTNQTDNRSTAGVSKIGGLGTVNTQTNYVTIAYKLTKVSDGSELSSGSFKASNDGPDANQSIGQAMKKIADKVTETIKKAGPVAK